jgi:NTE family protein
VSSDDPARPDDQHSGRNTTKIVNVALQGGGAHGAFAWGVFDYLLEDGRLDVCGISGAVPAPSMPFCSLMV